MLFSRFCTLLEVGREDIDGLLRCHFTGGMAAHAIAHDESLEVGEEPVGVLVRATDSTDICSTCHCDIRHLVISFVACKNRVKD